MTTQNNNITLETLRDNADIIDTAEEGTCTLFKYNDIEYVVLQDNTIITREEDNNGLSDPVFPY